MAEYFSNLPSANTGSYYPPGIKFKDSTRPVQAQSVANFVAPEPVAQLLQDLPIEEIIKNITTKPEETDKYLLYNLLVNNYNIYLDKIVANVNNPNSPEFKLEFYYGDSLKDQPIIVGNLKDFKDLNMTYKGKKQSSKNYLQTIYLNAILKDVKRTNCFIRHQNIFTFFPESLFKMNSFLDIIFVSKLLQHFFGTDEFPDLQATDYTFQEGEDIDIKSDVGQHETKLLFNNLVNKPLLQKLINAIFLFHQGYVASFNKSFNNIDINILQFIQKFILIFDSENKIVSRVSYLEDNYTFNSSPKTLPRGIIILSVSINSIDNDCKIAYIPLYNSMYLEPLNYLMSIPDYNSNTEITYYFITNYIKYYNLLLKRIITLSNNINILENLNNNRIEQYVRINPETDSKTDSENIYKEFQDVYKWNNELKIVNYSKQISNTPFETLDILLTVIYTSLLICLKDRQILNGIPLSVNIFITKAKLLSLISTLDEDIKQDINKNIFFLDIIQMNNFRLNIYKLHNISTPKASTKYEYQELMRNLDTKINMPEIPNSMIFNFIITADEKTKSQLNKEDSLEYSEYEKILFIAEDIHKFMTKYIAIHIPFSSYHIRDMLIASLFSKLIYGKDLNTMWYNIPAKLIKDSNLDKVFMYSLLHNTTTKKNQTLSQYPKNEMFLREFLTHMNMKLEGKDNRSMIQTIQKTILQKIIMRTEFMKTDYFNPDYNIFESCGINLPFYRLITEDPIVVTDNTNTVSKQNALAPTNRTNSGNINGGVQLFEHPEQHIASGGFNKNKNKNRTKNYIKNNKKSKNINGNKITRRPRKHSQIKGYKYKKTSKI